MKIHGTAKGGALSKKDFGVAFGGGEVSQIVSGDNLKAYYRFSAASGNITNVAGTVANNDTIGSDADLTNNDITLGESGSPSNFGTNALFEPSESSYGVAPSGTESNFDFFFDGSSWSVSFWYKASSDFSSNQHVIDTHASADDNYGMDIRTNQYEGEDDHKIRVVITNGSLMVDFKSTDDYVPDETNFHHYVFTWNNSTATMWRDAANKATKSGSAGSSGTSTDVMTVGGYSNNPTSGTLKGNLCELSIWNRVLSDDDITELYNSGAGLVLNDQ